MEAASLPGQEVGTMELAPGSERGCCYPMVHSTTAPQHQQQAADVAEQWAVGCNLQLQESDVTLTTPLYGHPVSGQGLLRLSLWWPSHAIGILSSNAAIISITLYSTLSIPTLSLTATSNQSPSSRR